jgi:hypothetical protein
MPILFSFIPVNVTLLLLPIANIHMQPLPLPQLPLTTRRQIGTYGALSFFSLSLALFLTRAIIWVSLSLSSQLFFAPSVLSLSRARDSFEPKTKNETLRALDDKQTREEEEEKNERKRRTSKLTSAI